MATKEVDLWITENAGGVRVDSVGVANLNIKELRALIEFLRGRLGKKVNEEKNTSST